MVGNRMRDAQSVDVCDENGEVIWRRFRRDGHSGGTASRNYIADGSQHRIIEALAEALCQARAEMSAFDVADVVSDVGSATTQVNHCIPMPVTRH